MIRDGRRQETYSEGGAGRMAPGSLPGGSLVVAPARKAKPEPVIRERTFDYATWKRNKRLTDPEWAEQQRQRERERYARNKAAAA